MSGSSPDSDTGTSFIGLVFKFIRWDEFREGTVGIAGVVRTRALATTIIGSFITFVFLVVTGVFASVSAAISGAFDGVAGFVSRFVVAVSGVIEATLGAAAAESVASVASQGLLAFVFATIVVAITAFVVSKLVDAFREGF